MFQIPSILVNRLHSYLLTIGFLLLHISTLHWYLCCMENVNLMFHHSDLKMLQESVKAVGKIKPSPLFQVDVVVCTASKNLDLDKGRASKAVVQAAGSEMKEECSAKYPGGIEYDEVAVVNGGNMPCKKVYFISLPVWGTGHNEHEVGVALKSYQRQQNCDTKKTI